VGERHVEGETSAVPAEEASSLSPNIGQTLQDSTSSLGLFLRRGDREEIEGNFLDGLEEFEALSLKRQRKTLENNLLKISEDTGSAFGDVLHLFLTVSSVRCGARFATHGN